VFSGHTEESEWVKDEIKIALDKKIKIIPFRIENVEPQGALRILKVRFQWLDAFTPLLKNHLKRLVEVVCQHLGIEPVQFLETKHLEPEEKPIPEYAKKDGKEKRNVPEDLPADVKNIVSKAIKVEKNKNGYWEAYYQDGIVMVYIPPGKFMMGADDGRADERPSHEVDLDSYWIGKYEVTFTQYDRYCEEAGKTKPDDKGWGRENRPVIDVSWNDAAAYCEWLSGKTGLKFKVPTEAQWEKAARGTDGRKYPWGNDDPNENLANFNSNNRNIGQTHPVGSHPQGASPYGLLDMAGNVLEWCYDWYDEKYYCIKFPPKNPKGPQCGPYRILRGGGWYFDASQLRCTFRNGDNQPHNFVGFRLCQEI